MKRLLLLRHAKAVAAGSKSGDHDRALNDRGRADAPRMGVAMEHKGYVPDLVLCSTAKRTVETWEHVLPELGAKPAVEFMDELYLASPRTIANIVRKLKTDTATLLVIGHNPGLEECARALVRKSRPGEERDRYERMAEKFPTAALAVIDFDVETWSEVEPSTGALFDYLRPRDITGV